ncbi:MAG TPA: radical SAM protein [Pseudomonadota bacterium]|nr:radical SAM protein [Pseudomonadota bacterium]
MKTPAPRWICLQLVQDCNLRCRMCYEWGTTGVHKTAIRPRELAFDVVARIIDEVAAYRPHFDLFGGEPLLYPRIAEVVRLIKERGCSLDIATNGTRLGALADELVDAAVDRVWVSIDGPEPINDHQRGRGTFQSVLGGLAALRASRARRPGGRPQVGVTYVVTPLNHHAIAETFLTALEPRWLDLISIEYQSFLTAGQLQGYDQLLRERFHTRTGVRFAAGLLRDPAEFAGIDTAAVARQIAEVRGVYEAAGRRVLTRPRVTTAENGAAYFAGRFEEMADYHPRCVFPWLYAEVAASGDVTPCHSFYDLTFGNVNQHPLLEIWRSERFEAARRFFKGSLSPVCQACCLYHTAAEGPPGADRP